MRNTIRGRSTRRLSVPASVRPCLEQVGRLAQARGLAAYAVGGCVRDWLLGDGRTSDLDVTVEGSGIEIAEAVARALGGCLRVHQQFRTATVILPARSRGRTGSRRPTRIDFATARKETYVRPAAYPRVSAGTLREDLFRRDFTINAMAVALAPGRFGTLIDPFGGEADLRRGLLRVLHARSFLDDPSRALRGVRLLTRFGLRWECCTDGALRKAMAAGALGWLNAGRLRKELERMREEPDPRACLAALVELLGVAGRG